MDADEKLLALKKAYADIILNTSKEAAERVLISEKKALKFQHELSVAKDEAVRMMIRLKNMMDCKNSEAEMTSLIQQGKIEELEAQLNEAEDIVSDLREELRYVKAKLQKVSEIKVENLDEHNTASREEASEKKRLCSYQSLRNPPSEHESLAISNMKTLDLTQRITKCCKQLVHTRNTYGAKLEIPSIILRRKHHESCRNGCTQRIHACERNSNGDSSLSGNPNHVNNDRMTEGDEEDKSVHPALIDEAKNMCHIENKEAELEDNRSTSSYQVQASDSFCRKKNRDTRCRKNRSPSGKQLCDQSVKIHSLGISFLNNNSAQHKENPTGVAQNISLNITDMDLQPDCAKPSKENVRKFDDEIDDENKSTKREALIDVPVLAEQEDRFEESLVSQVPKTNCVETSEPVVHSEFITLETTETIPSYPLNLRVIKHTFQRKRKREPVSSFDGSISLENSTSQKKREEYHDAANPEKSCLVLDSSQDSRQSPKVPLQTSGGSRVLVKGASCL